MPVPWRMLGAVPRLAMTEESPYVTTVSSQLRHPQRKDDLPRSSFNQPANGPRGALFLYIYIYILMDRLVYPHDLCCFSCTICCMSMSRRLFLDTLLHEPNPNAKPNPNPNPNPKFLFQKP